MICGKGLTLKSIEHAYKSHFHMDPMQLYKHLYDGNIYVFDLTKGQTCFFMNKNMTVSTLKKFQRKIKTKYTEGKIDEYFK